MQLMSTIIINVKMCNILMTKTLNYSITIHGAKNRSLSSMWSLLKLFYFSALQVNHTYDEKSTAALYEGLWKTLEMLTGF